jgi:hypothetical protein
MDEASLQKYLKSNHQLYTNGSKKNSMKFGNNNNESNNSTFHLSQGMNKVILSSFQNIKLPPMSTKNIHKSNYLTAA